MLGRVDLVERWGDAAAKLVSDRLLQRARTLRDLPWSATWFRAVVVGCCPGEHPAAFADRVRWRSGATVALPSTAQALRLFRCGRETAERWSAAANTSVSVTS